MSDPIDPVWGVKLSSSELERLKQGLPTTNASNFKRVDEVAPLDADDLACFAELREVLSKHKKLERFGITLLHSHFDMAQNEVLVETIDSKARSMVQEPRILDTSDITSIDTQWYLGGSMPLSLVKCRTSMHS